MLHLIKNITDIITTNLYKTLRITKYARARATDRISLISANQPFHNNDLEDGVSWSVRHVMDEAGNLLITL